MLESSKFVLKKIRLMLIIVVPVLLVCASLCIIWAKEMEKTIINDTSVISKSAESTVDGRLTELVRIVKTLELSVDNRYIKNLTEDIHNTPYQMYNLSVRMHEFAGSNSLIKKLYAYYPNTNYVVSTVGAYRAEHFYYLDNGHEKERLNQWKLLITQIPNNSFYIYDTGKEKRFCYIDKLYNAGNLVATFVIEIDNSKMSEVLSSSRANDGIAFVMLIDNDPIIVSGDQDLFYSNSEVILSSQLKEGTNIENGNYIFAHASKLSGLSYMTLHKSKGLLHATYTLVKVCVFCLIGCLIFIIAISAFIGHKQHKNIQIIMDKLGNITGDKTKDEYSIIADRIDQLVSVAYKDSKQMLKYQSMLNSLFLNFILQNKFDGESDFARAAVRYGISFEYLSYRIVIIKVPKESSDISTIENHLYNPSFCERHQCGMKHCTDFRYLICFPSDIIFP